MIPARGCSSIIATLACCAWIDFNLPEAPAGVGSSTCTTDFSKTVVDGDFSPGEWDCTEPMPGKLSYF